MARQGKGKGWDRPEAITEILNRYGRKRANGRLLYCTPSQLEQAHSEFPKSGWKVIYDTEQQAQAAALEIYNISGLLMSSYPCERSKRDPKHRHLSKRPIRSKAGQLRGGRGVRTF